MKHLLSTEDLSYDQAMEILSDAASIKASLINREVKKLPTLRGKTIITVFYENSTRTRVSFETAGKWLSADVINVSAGTSSVAKGESLEDTALTLRAIGADALVVRHPDSGAVAQIASWTDRLTAHGTLAGAGSGPSVINAGDGLHQHPTQALLDALTLTERLGSVKDKRVVIVGDIVHSRVARSNAALLSTLGAKVVLIGPTTLLPVGASLWPNVTVDTELDSYLPDADAVMMLRVQAERMNGGYFPSEREYSIRYGLNNHRRTLLPKKAIILHPGPMVRGMEIGYHVAEDSRAAVLEQVTNGVHIRMAVLYQLLLGHSKNSAAHDTIVGAQ